MIKLSQQLQHITTAINNLPQSIESKALNTARTLALSGKYDLACSQIESQAFIEPRHKMEAILLLAKIYAQQGAFEKAAAHWKQILRMDSGNQEAVSGLAAISRHYQTPAMLRIITFIGTCFVILCIVLGSGFFLTLQSRKIEKHIDAVESRSQSLTLEKTRNIEERIQKIQVILSNGLDESFNKLGQQIDLLNEKGLQRDQALRKKVTESVSEITLNEKNNHQSLLKRVSDLEANLTEQKKALFNRVAPNIERLTQNLNQIESTLGAFKLSFEEIKRKQSEKMPANSKVLEDRLKSLEQNLFEIRSILSTDNNI